MNFEYLHPADQLVMIMQRIYERGMTTTSGGNLSIQDESGDIWITPAGIDKGSLTRADIICVKPDGTCIGPHTPSSELPFHKSIYARRPDLHAVLHAHSPAIVAFSIARRLPDVDLVPTVHKTCGALTMASYALPGSDELGENIGKEFDKGFNTVILENHGVCIGAKTMFEAFMKFETLEYSASLEILASKIGTPRRLTEEEIHRTQTKDHLMMDDFIPRLCTTEERAARRDMIKFIHRSYRQGLFSATHGTYSVKLSDGSFLITPFGKDRAYLSEEDLVRIKSGMKEQNKIPSRAVKFFEAVYKHNPDIGAILLAHPLHVMAFAVTDASFDAHTIPESYILLREIKKQPMDGVYFNQDEAAKQFCNRVPAIIYNNECVVVTGKDLVQAFDRLEVAEATAYSIISARDAGPIQHITEEEAKDLKRAFKLED